MIRHTCTVLSGAAAGVIAYELQLPVVLRGHLDWLSAVFGAAAAGVLVTLVVHYTGRRAERWLLAGRRPSALAIRNTVAVLIGLAVGICLGVKWSVLLGVLLAPVAATLAAAVLDCCADAWPEFIAFWRDLFTCDPHDDPTSTRDIDSLPALDRALERGE